MDSSDVFPSTDQNRTLRALASHRRNPTELNIMKFFFARYFDTRIWITAGILAGALSGAPQLARAEYIPHPGLTPYQIVTGVGAQENCIDAKPVGANSWEPILQPCNASSNSQKFYVLRRDLRDFVPQKDGFRFDEPNTHIALAAEFDKNPGSQYALLDYSSSLGSRIGVSLMIAGVSSDQVYGSTWRIERPQSQWVQRADEGSQFKTNPGDVKRARYGVSDDWKYKDAAPNEWVYCNNDSFGGDPHYGRQKACYEWQGTSVDTPLLVNILTASSMQCLTNTNGSLSKGEDSACKGSQAKWTLRPTKYPR